MNLQKRLDDLERRADVGPPRHIVVLMGWDCDEYDRAYAAGEHDAALAILARNNPYVPLQVLREHYLEASARLIDGVIVAPTGDAWI